MYGHCGVTCHSPSGLHISLMTKDISDPDVPDCFRIGRRVDFEFDSIISLRTLRRTPQNIIGQSTDTNGMRYYPMRWIFVNVNCVEFQFCPRYPPHISVCCVAVQLNVDHVDEFTKHWQASEATPSPKQLSPTSAIQSAETWPNSNDGKIDSICGLVKVPQCIILLSILLTVFGVEMDHAFWGQVFSFLMVGILTFNSVRLIHSFLFSKRIITWH